MRKVLRDLVESTREALLALGPMPPPTHYDASGRMVCNPLHLGWELAARGVCEMAHRVAWRIVSGVREYTVDHLTEQQQLRVFRSIDEFRVEMLTLHEVFFTNRVDAYANPRADDQGLQAPSHAAEEREEHQAPPSPEPAGP